MSPWTILFCLLLLGTAFAGGYYEGHHQEQNVLTAQIATIKANDATTLAKAESDARAQEKASAQHLAVIQQTYEEDKAHAKQASDAIVASLKSRTLQLRPQFSCTPQLAASVSKAASGGSIPDATTDLRFQSAGDLVRAADDADADIKALQSIIRADRGLPDVIVPNAVGNH